MSNKFVKKKSPSVEIGPAPAVIDVPYMRIVKAKKKF
jgi:hypothetical protein